MGGRTKSEKGGIFSSTGLKGRSISSDCRFVKSLCVGSHRILPALLRCTFLEETLCRRIHGERTIQRRSAGPCTSSHPFVPCPQSYYLLARRHILPHRASHSTENITFTSWRGPFFLPFLVHRLFSLTNPFLCPTHSATLCEPRGTAQHAGICRLRHALCGSGQYHPPFLHFQSFIICLDLLTSA